MQPIELGQEGVFVAVEGTRVCLPAGVVGEQVAVVPLGRGDHARLARVVTRSPVRRTPPCPLLHRCGACSLQEMDYRAQVEHKSAVLRAAIVRATGCEPDRVADVRPQPAPFGYRTKLLMPSGGEPGALRFGFHRRGTLQLVPAEGCPVQHPLSLALLACTRQVLDAQRVGPSNVRGGWLHAVAIRVDPSSDRGELTLAACSTRPPGGERLIEQLAAVPGIHAVHLTASPERSSFPIGPQHKRLAGPRRTPFHLAGHELLLSPGTFFQSSSAGAELLAAEVLDLLPQRCRCLADLYGGAGTFTRLAAGRWQRALVIDENPSAIADLRHQLQQDRLPGAGAVTAAAGRIEDKLGLLEQLHPDVVILDPPRRGCRPPVIEAVLGVRPDLVLHVACSFAALLQDTAPLLAAGYRLQQVRAVDMFPHTAHLEVVAALAAPC